MGAFDESRGVIQCCFDLADETLIQDFKFLGEGGRDLEFRIPLINCFVSVWLEVCIHRFEDLRVVFIYICRTGSFQGRDWNISNSFRCVFE